MAASRLKAFPLPAVQPSNAIRQNMLKRSDIQRPLWRWTAAVERHRAWIIASASVELIM
jgi:hypothetical protein